MAWILVGIRAGCMVDTFFDEEFFHQMQKRLDLTNGLKAKYGSTIDKILAKYEKNRNE